MVKQTVFRHKQFEFDKYIAPDSSEYSFDNAFDRFIWGRNGDGMPGITYRTERGPFQDGVTPLGFVLNPRIIQLVHRRNGNCRDDYWDNRADILNLLRPNRQPTDVFQGGVLRKELPNGDQRDLCVLISRGPDFPSSNDRWDEWSIQDVIRFIAHDPLYFDPNENQRELTLPTTTDELDFPITFPITFSSPGGVPTDSITYTGTFKSFPTLILQGPMTEPRIDNVTTGKKIEFETGAVIAANRTVTISLPFGDKTVVDDLGNNLIGSLTNDSDLVDFTLVPEPVAVGGINQLGVTAQLTDANSAIFIKWFTRFIGI